MLQVTSHRDMHHRGFLFLLVAFDLQESLGDSSARISSSLASSIHVILAAVDAREICNLLRRFCGVEVLMSHSYTGIKRRQHFEVWKAKKRNISQRKL